MPAPGAGTSVADPLQTLRDRFAAAVRAAFADLGAPAPAEIDPNLVPARDTRFGDYQCNAAMALAKQIGKPPREVAAAIARHADLAGVAEPLTDASIAGPGFINVRLAADALAAALDALDTPALGITPASPAQTIVVDLCGVNLAKQMHVGHLRSTVIGDALARAFERLGHRVLRQSHFGDWGLPIAMVTARIKRLSDAGTIDLRTITLDELDAHYKAAQRACERDSKALAACERYGLGPKATAECEAQVAGAEEEFLHARQTLVALQRHDPAVYAVWRRIADVTIGECMAICARLGANVDASMIAGESTYADELAPLVADIESRTIAEVSDGALIVRLDEYGVTEPMLVRKSDGGFLYATTDMAAVRRRVQRLGADRVIYAVDARQALHFRQVFAGARKAGYARRADGTDASLQHAAFGTVLGDDGRPFKTRSGENVRLSDLLDEAIARAERAVAERDPDLSAAERRAIAEGVGIAAIKYTDLSTDRVKDYVFYFDRMLAFEGDTGPYLLYALVRTRSIFRKAAERGADGAAAGRAALLIREPAEKALALTLLRYPSAVRGVAEALEPHRLCGYLHDLAGAFSAFFTACPVLHAPDAQTRDSRLRLCALTAAVLEDGLRTLGIPTVERM